MSGSITKHDIKTAAELTAVGGTESDLPQDTQVYVTANSINKPLKDAIEDGDLGSSGIPAGSMILWGGTSDPSGWAICDGRSLLRASYPDLFTNIGTANGSASGTEFNIPDARGRFPRGVDAATGRDPDAASRTAAAAGGNTGDAVGSVQDDQLESHSHTDDFYAFAQGLGAGGFGYKITNAGFTASNTGSTGGNETRPKNFSVNFIIKLFNG